MADQFDTLLENVFKAKNEFENAKEELKKFLFKTEKVNSALEEKVINNIIEKNSTPTLFPIEEKLNIVVKNKRSLNKGNSKSSVTTVATKVTPTANNGKLRKWTAEEANQCLYLSKKGVPVNEIAKKLNRTVKSVQMMIYKKRSQKYYDKA